MRYDQAEFEHLPEVIQKTLKENVVIVENQRFDGELIKTRKVSKGFFLFGNTGSGKTYALHAIRRLLGRPKIENWVELLFELKGKFQVRDGVTTLINDLTDSDYIFLDDIGAEKQSEWSQEMLYLIINRAYNDNRTLFISTNLTEKEFVEKYGERIFDRIQETCSLVKMPNKNYRQN